MLLVSMNVSQIRICLAVASQAKHKTQMNRCIWRKCQNICFQGFHELKLEQQWQWESSPQDHKGATFSFPLSAALSLPRHFFRTKSELEKLTEHMKLQQKGEKWGSWPNTRLNKGLPRQREGQHVSPVDSNYTTATLSVPLWRWFFCFFFSIKIMKIFNSLF